MASKKADFSTINTERVYKTMADAAAPEQEEDKEATAHGSQTAKARKTRKTYSIEEQLEAINTGRTMGMKNVKLPRINMAFTGDNYEYVRTMARARGESMTDFVNHLVELSRKENAELYNKVLEFRNSL